MFFNIAFSILLWAAVAGAIVKLIPKFYTAKRYIVSPVPKREGAEVTTGQMLYVFMIAVLFRAAVYGIGAIDSIMVQRSNTFDLNTYLEWWKRWDAPRYISIAENGYTGMLEEGEPLNCVFFPLYPWLVRVFTFVIPDTRIACMRVSSLAYTTAMPFMYSFVAKYYGKKIAALSCIYISVSPFGFFLCAMMNESVFILMLVLTWYFINRHKWMYAAVSGFFCTLSRSVGVLAVIPYAVELISANAGSFEKNNIKR